MNFANILQYVVFPAIAAVVSWYAGRHARRSQAIERLQETLDKVMIQNCELNEQVVALRRENSALKTEVSDLRTMIERAGLNRAEDVSE